MFLCDTSAQLLVFIIAHTFFDIMFSRWFGAAISAASPIVTGAVASTNVIANPPHTPNIPFGLDERWLPQDRGPGYLVYSNGRRPLLKNMISVLTPAQSQLFYANISTFAKFTKSSMFSFTEFHYLVTQDGLRIITGP